MELGMGMEYFFIQMDFAMKANLKMAYGMDLVF